MAVGDGVGLGQHGPGGGGVVGAGGDGLGMDGAGGYGRTENGGLMNAVTARTVIGKKRFSFLVKQLSSTFVIEEKLVQKAFVLTPWSPLIAA